MPERIHHIDFVVHDLETAAARGAYLLLVEEDDG